MSLYNFQTPVHAAIINRQIDMLEKLISNSNLDHDGNPLGNEKKYLVQPSFIKEYIASRKREDECGNNPMHFVFNCVDAHERFQMLRLLIDEDVGSPNRRNICNYLPN